MSAPSCVRLPWFLAAGLALAAPAAAQNIASAPGTVDRHLDRLTLLPGPYLLSPGRGVAAPPPAGTAPGSFRFLPSNRRTDPTKPPSAQPQMRLGVLVLGSNASDQGFVPPHLARPTTPRPELLRFDSRLRADPAALPLRALPAVKRD
ncbi:MAG: hypothetical protein HZC55_16720 [Verrucomicrobia bacterium]|jgi:hypothetical protein|nr:hypothetical protein [Verrucomicrobiota bacterium]